MTIHDLLHTTTRHGCLLEMLGRNRNRELVRWRMVGMYVCRDKYGMTLQAIGRVFRRHHSTVLHAVRAVQRARRADWVTERLEEITQ